MNANKTKAFPLFFGLLVLLSFKVSGQVQAPLPAPIDTAPSPGYVCVQRGPDSKVWQQAILQTNMDGDVSTNYQSYTELATGLSYLNNNGQYVDSVEQVDAIPGGAQAVQGRHQVQWALDANTPGGAVTITTPDNKQLSVTVFGMAYFDSASGSNAPVAYLQDSTGTIAAPNRVIYGNAFSNLTADLCYTYTKAGLSQDVVLRQAPQAPDAYGLSDATTVLQVYSEFFNAGDPEAAAVTNGNVLDDRILNFGAMSMGVGHALFLDGQQTPISGSSVNKQWIHVNNRTFLVESVAWSAISNQVQALHPASNLNPRRASVRGLALLESGPKSSRLVKTPNDRTEMQLAKVDTEGKRVVVDWDLLSGSANITLQGDTTYLVSSTVNVTDILTVEGGTVVKYTNTGAGQIMVSEPIVFQTASYRPAVFTSMFDGTVGSPVTTATNAPSVTSTYLNLSLYTSQTLRNCRFSYASTAVLVTSEASDSIKLWDCQFFGCGTGLSDYADTGTVTLYAYNVLFSYVSFGLVDQGGAGTISAVAVNVTADNMHYFAYDFGTSAVVVTNCVLTSVTNLPGSSWIYNCAVYSSSSGVYQPTGAAGYYLNTTNATLGVTNHAAGTTSIDTNLLADLQTLTTYPPAILPYAITTSTNLTNQVPRNTGLPDRGYHYCPIDYAANLEVSGATVTIAPGIVVCSYGNQVGFWLGNNGNIQSAGTATSPAYIVRYNTVQEQSNTNWEMTPGGWEASVLADGSGGWATFSFTDWAALEQDYQIYINGYSYPFTFQNCQFYNGQIKIWQTSCTSSNCLYARVAGNLTEVVAQSDLTTFYNNLFWNGSLTVKHSGTGIWTFRDNLFDQCNITNKGTANINNCFSNAYATSLLSSPQYLPGDTRIVPLAASPAYQTGTLGQFYYPSNQTNLIFYGSQLASAAGLYHYTVTTNNTIDGANMVSIGFHYVATDNNGIPLDTYGDGMPDYIKDANGDGLYDAGDLVNWLNPFNIYDQGRNYGGYYPSNVRLSYWRFNTSAETDEHGNPTYSNSGATQTADWSSNSVYLTTGCNLQYYTVQPGSTWTNFDAANGTVRFWFKPHWSSPNVGGTGPGHKAAFLNFTETSGYGWELSTSPNGQVLQLLCNSNFIYGPGAGNDISASPKNWVCTFVQNQWYQIALSYSPSNIAAYVNGSLVGTATWPAEDLSGMFYESAYGMVFWPTIGTSEYFSVGNDYTTTDTANGEIDELETFNYPLSAQAIAYGFATFNGANYSGITSDTQDSDYVGRTDLLRLLVDAVPSLPAPNSVTPCRLGYWRFNSPSWIGEEGQFPTTAINVSMATGWSGGALNVGSAANSELTYPAAYTNGWASMNCRQGSVRFWFQPNWTTAPASAPFIYLGTGSADCWDLETGTSGNTISFICASNSSPYNPIQNVAVPFSTNQWTEIVFTYGPDRCVLYTNGMPAKTNAAIFTNWPNATAQALGLIIGNDATGNHPINGKFDELETFNYELNANQIWTNFQAVWNIDNNLDGIPDIIQDTILHTNTPFLGQPMVVAGTIEAEQFDRGGSNYACFNVSNHPVSNYRATGMDITACNDLGGGYCLDQTQAGDWANYTISVLAAQTYAVETRVAGIGTNGLFQEVFSLQGHAPYATNGPFHIATNGWANVTGTVNLVAGTNVMQLQLISAGTVSPYVGQFNYFTIYPYWTPPTFGSTVTPVTLTAGTNFAIAASNAALIQSAINGLPSTGGTVDIGPGRFYVAQPNPDEGKDAEFNTVGNITQSNVRICCTGTNTILIGYNRVTTMFFVGRDNLDDPAYCQNITFSNLTLQAQPHMAISNQIGSTIVYQSGMYHNTNVWSDMLVGIQGSNGATSTRFANNILFTNCNFINADVGITVKFSVSNLLVKNCNFLWTSNLYIPGECITNVSYITNSSVDGYILVGIFAAYTNYNIGVTDCTYVGGTNSGTNYITNQLASGNGFLFYQGAGNSFALRNLVTNNAEEAMQFCSGPVAIAGNTFWSLAINNSACALVPNFLDGGTTGSLSPSITFVGNSVVGNAYGSCNDTSNMIAPYTLNFSGNSLALLSPLTQPYLLNPNDGTGVYVSDCQSLNVCGNTMTGAAGVGYYSSCSNSVILANNFGAVTLRSIMDGGTSPVISSQVIGNILGRGISYHLKATFSESPNWFLYNNQYLDMNLNTVPIFTDPADLWAHITP